MSNRAKDYLSRALKTLTFPFLVCLFFGIATNGRIFSTRSVLVILRQSVMPGIIVMAMLPNVSLGLMDFSIGAVVTASAIISGNLMMMTGTGIPGLLVFTIIISVILTSLTGFLNNKLRVPILVITLGLTLVYEAIPSLLFPEKQSAIIDLKYSKLAQAPYIFIVFIIAFAIYYIMTNKTAYGHNIRAMGGNSELARRAGLNVEKITQTSFIVSGVFAGLAAAVYMCSRGQVNAPGAYGSMGLVIDAFLGLYLGVFLAQFCNETIGLTIAVITMTVLTNGLLTMGVDATYRDIVQSVVLFLLLAFSGNQPYFSKYRADKKRAKLANEAYGKA